MQIFLRTKILQGRIKPLNFLPGDAYFEKKISKKNLYAILKFLKHVKNICLFSLPVISRTNWTPSIFKTTGANI